MFEKLVKIADELDALGLSEKADRIDDFLSKMAESGMHTVPTYVADDDQNEITPSEIIEAIKALDSDGKLAVLSWFLQEELYDSEEVEEDSDEEDSDEEDSDEEDLFEFEDDEEEEEEHSG